MKYDLICYSFSPTKHKRMSRLYSVIWASMSFERLGLLSSCMSYLNQMFSSSRYLFSKVDFESQRFYCTIICCKNIWDNFFTTNKQEIKTISKMVNKKFYGFNYFYFIQPVLVTWNSFMNSVIHGSCDQFLYFSWCQNSRAKRIHRRCTDNVTQNKKRSAVRYDTLLLTPVM